MWKTDNFKPLCAAFVCDNQLHLEVSVTVSADLQSDYLKIFFSSGAYCNILFVNKIREMVSFELSKEIEKDVFLLVTSEGKRITSEFPWGIEPQAFGFCDHLCLCVSVVEHLSAGCEV